MSSSRTAPGPSKAAPSKSASRRRGEKTAIGRQGEKVAPVKAPKPALAKPASPKPPSNRAERTAERREAIIEAALDEFISRGFTATRIDDVARRAGVAKGTIYLHFKDKESMFEELIRTVLAGCNQRKDPGYQGWVEADMIFVSPDESGRVIKLDVREGDEIKQGAPLYSVDDDLQKADLNQNNATLANAQQTYDRAASLSKTGSGTQATLDAAVSALRVAEARV